MKFKLGIRMGNLSDSEHGGVVGDVSRLYVQKALHISETGDLLGFSHTSVSMIYREWSERENIQ